MFKITIGMKRVYAEKYSSRCNLNHVAVPGSSTDDGKLFWGGERGLVRHT